MGNFTFHETKINGVFIIDVKTFGDHRGFFMETYKEPDFFKAGITCRFVQDNQSASQRGVLRGLHFQKSYPQAKLVRVLHGEVFDVAVDLRRRSNTYGQWVGVILSSANKRQLLIPRGFAHGFLVLSDYAEFSYKCDDVYHPEDEGGILWNDPDIGIDWPIDEGIILSDKDKNNPLLKTLNVVFD